MSTLQLLDEVWSKVVSFRCFQDRKNQEDEAHLWLDLRRVNRTFANAVEKYNIDRYLRRAAIRFNFGVRYVQNPDNPDDEDDMIKLSIAPVFSFDGLGESNPRLAVFADRECVPCFRKYMARSLNDDSGFQMIEKTHRIQHVMSLRRHVHELPLINMEAEFGPDKDLVMKFDWRATFTVWWAESKALEEDSRRNGNSNVAWAEELKPGPHYAADPFNAIKKIILRLAAQREASFRRIRRKRITRLVARLDHIRLDERNEDSRHYSSSIKKREAIKAMNAWTDSMNFAEVSDDSEEEGSEDDEGDEAEPEAGYWEGSKSDLD